jgi:hypothetical protein
MLLRISLLLSFVLAVLSYAAKPEGEPCSQPLSRAAQGVARANFLEEVFTQYETLDLESDLASLKIFQFIDKHKHLFNKTVHKGLVELYNDLTLRHGSTEYFWALEEMLLKWPEKDAAPLLRKVRGSMTPASQARYRAAPSEILEEHKSFGPRERQILHDIFIGQETKLVSRQIIHRVTDYLKLNRGLEQAQKVALVKNAFNYFDQHVGDLIWEVHEKTGDGTVLLCSPGCYHAIGIRSDNSAFYAKREKKKSLDGFMARKWARYLTKLVEL